MAQSSSLAEPDEEEQVAEVEEPAMVLPLSLTFNYFYFLLSLSVVFYSRYFAFCYTLTATW